MPRQENLVPGASYALARNVAEVNTTGAELDLQWNKTINDKQQLYAGLGLLWLNSTSSDNEPSFYVSSHAKWLTNLFAEWRSSRFSLSTTAVYKIREAQEASAIEAELTRSYFVMNLRVGYYAVKNKLQFFLQIDNVFDKSYSDLLGAPMPGRWTMLGIGWRR